MKNLKTFEEFNMISQENTELVEEGLGDLLRGVNWYKKNWKVAFGYYKKMNNQKMMELVAKRGTEEDKNNWKSASGGRELQLQTAFREALDKVENETKGGKMISEIGGGVNRSQENNKAKEASLEFKENPTIWDEEIEKYATK